MKPDTFSQYINHTPKSEFLYDYYDKVRVYSQSFCLFYKLQRTHKAYDIMVESTPMRVHILRKGKSSFRTIESNCHVYAVKLPKLSPEFIFYSLGTFLLVL